ncbi:ATP-dependent RNA helicase dbp7 [Lecanosticta acicola]|uniref:ATP-dependent RNA helicase n=1 Tax=Lecanosticta acicola TaxID=111012 RepID=A0AAI9E962_9PEZI|nr:ATP-dependent RNA helicase dbp7 [Lecanosticta acicola]
MDDGLLVNFQIPEDYTAPSTKLKGGRWKDRLTARKSAEYGRKKALERGDAPPPSAVQQAEKPVFVEGRPAKRARTQRADDTLPKTSNGEVISSLFTFNPASRTIPENADGDKANEEPLVEPSNAPLAENEESKFTSLGLSSNLASHLLRKLEIKAPTAIQRKAVQQLCHNDTDAFIQAQTGSGKTLAYLLPIIERITAISRRMKEAGESFDRHSGLFAIILAPTRELSKQISTVLEDLLSCCHWIVSSTVIGGEKKKSEKARLRKGLNILVATPGRLADHIENTENLDLSNVRWLVLDEGDRLMELGFEQDIQKMISVLNLRARKKQEKPIPGLPSRRTTVLCSATIKANVEQLQSISLKEPVSISVDQASEPAEDGGGDGEPENNFSAPAQLKQGYAVVPPKQRLVTLVGLLKQTFKRKGSVMKCIVFMSCADSVDFHFELLTSGSPKTDTVDAPVSSETTTNPRVKQRAPPKKSSKPGSIPQGNTIPEARTEGQAAAISGKDNPVQMFRLHGSLQQATRTSTLKAFTKMTDPAVLVCTDVASRGLDLPNVDLVIEYDPPFSKDDHLHRIGRTARAGRDGRALIFLQPGCEEGYVEILKEGKPRNLTRHDADELLQKGFGPEKGVAATSSSQWEQTATDWQLEAERWVQENPKHLEQARRAYQSHIRAYATHVSSERHVFNMQELHLGHLAKAFALRDKPGSINVPGMRPGKDAGAKSKKHTLQQQQGKRKRDDNGDGEAGAVDPNEAKRKMMAKMKSLMTGASEFNTM